MNSGNKAVVASTSSGFPNVATRGDTANVAPVPQATAARSDAGPANGRPGRLGHNRNPEPPMQTVRSIPRRSPGDSDLGVVVAGADPKPDTSTRSSGDVPRNAQTLGRSRGQASGKQESPVLGSRLLAGNQHQDATSSLNNDNNSARISRGTPRRPGEVIRGFAPNSPNASTPSDNSQSRPGGGFNRMEAGRGQGERSFRPPSIGNQNIGGSPQPRTFTPAPSVSMAPRSEPVARFAPAPSMAPRSAPSPPAVSAPAPAPAHSAPANSGGGGGSRGGGSGGGGRNGGKGDR